MTGRGQNHLGAGSIDWWSVLIYAALVIMGWLNIYAAVYNEAHANIFDVSQRYGMQLIWIGVSVCLAVMILLIDDKYYHMLAYPLYIASILVLIAVLAVGREVNGAKAWIFIGPVAIQPCEIVKFTTALAVARFMSRYSFSIHRFADLFKLAAIILLPAAIIILQNDTGSAVVYGSFLFVLYREGLNRWIYIGLGMAIALFLGSMMLTEVTVLISLIVLCVLSETISNGHLRTKLIFLCALALLTLGLYFSSAIVMKERVPVYYSLLISSAVLLPFVFIYAYRNRLRNVYRYVLMFAASLVFVSTVDYIFDNVLQIHQQKRILDLLGLESDNVKWGYNVNQSKIAIGSGGFLGKGYLEGTQTKFDFVPEQSTDFIFCTVGEEWGFVGSAVVVSLFCLLILRLMKMGERQRETFGRVYCYSVAGIFFVHVFINIGMTIGIMPVIGIPLPLFSYGGSSFLAFTMLFFVAVKLDAGKRELLRQ